MHKSLNSQIHPENIAEEMEDEEAKAKNDAALDNILLSGPDQMTVTHFKFPKHMYRSGQKTKAKLVEAPEGINSVAFLSPPNIIDQSHKEPYFSQNSSQVSLSPKSMKFRLSVPQQKPVIETFRRSRSD